MVNKSGGRFGSRIKLDHQVDPRRYSGPPFAVEAYALDSYDLPVCCRIGDEAAVLAT